jgi:predicted amidohydrolase YtcJ
MEREYVDIKYANTVKEVLQMIGERANMIQKGDWIIGWGYLWSRFEEKRPPYRHELDEVAPDNPVLLNFSAMGVANSLALKIAGVTKNSEPDYGEVELDKETGKPNGRLQGGAAVRLVSKHVPPLKVEPYEAGKLACDQWTRWGITTAHEAGATKTDFNVLQKMKRQGELNVRFRLYIHNMTNNLTFMDHALALGLEEGFGDDMLKISGVKLALDSMGSMGNAATYEPCTGNPGSLGILLVTPEKLEEMVVRAHKAGLQTATHSIGDRAIDINLDAIEAALKMYPRKDSRHRIEHCTLCTPKQLERIKALGVHPGESNYVWNFGDAYKYQFGPERSEWLYPYKSFQDHGIIASANSDYGGGPWHGNPIVGIYSMITRKTEGGDTVGMNQAIDVMEAIRCYTIKGAYGSFDEDRLGSIEVGKLADMIVLSDDITTVDSEKIKDITVLKTIVDGKLVYG